MAVKIKLDKKKVKKAARGLLSNSMALFAEIEGIDLDNVQRKTTKRNTPKKTENTHKQASKNKKRKERKEPKPVVISETIAYVVRYGKITRHFKSLSKAKSYARKLAKEKNTHVVIQTRENA